MKWYFAISESSLAFHQHDWPGLIEVAVMSAKKNTDLSPHLLYDGKPNALTAWLESQGVRILPHRVGFFDALERFANRPEIKTQHPNWLATAAGAFLRIDLPMIEQEDELVLYTDCDVIFQPGFSLKDLSKPYLFAAAGQTELDARHDMNSGVMLINIPEMRRAYKDFILFLRENLHLGFDQEILRPYFHGHFDSLPNVMNWKPYWGVNDEARIIHFHGPKPIIVRRLLDDPHAPAFPDWVRLFRKNEHGYRAYMQCWDSYVPDRPPEAVCHLDVFTDLKISGWAYYPKALSKIVHLNVFIDDRFVGAVACDTSRQDVRDAGYPEHVGYEFNFTDTLTKSQALRLEDAQGLRVTMRRNGADHTELRVE